MSLLLDKESMQDHIGEDCGVSDWVEITQENVNVFAEITKDPQFIHINPELAAKTMFGGTVAHGFMSLSMLSHFAMSGCGVTIRGATIGVNYGFEKVRFIMPVRVGKRIRGKARLLAVEETKPNQFRFNQEVTIEIEGEEKPAVVCEWITMAICT